MLLSVIRSHGSFRLESSMIDGEDLPMGFAVKVGRLQQLQNRVQSEIVQQDAPQDGLFRLEVLGRHLMQGGIDVFHG